MSAAGRNVAAFLAGVLELATKRTHDEAFRRAGERRLAELLRESRGKRLDPAAASIVLDRPAQRARERERPVWWPPVVTRHAVERFEIHFPAADIGGVLWDLAEGVEVAPELVQAATARRVASTTDTYVLGRERCGIHVLAPSLVPPPASCTNLAVVTYLRLSTEQRQVLDRLCRGAS